MRSWPSIITNRPISKNLVKTGNLDIALHKCRCAMCFHLIVYNTDCRASLYLILQMEGDYDTELSQGREAGHGRCTRQQSHQCKCGKTFQVESNFFYALVPFQFSWGLRDHIESEHGERDFSCPNCNKVFASAGNLSKHLGQRVCLDRLPATSLETVEVASDATEVTQVIIFSVSHMFTSMSGASAQEDENRGWI